MKNEEKILSLLETVASMQALIVERLNSLDKTQATFDKKQDLLLRMADDSGNRDCAILMQLDVLKKEVDILNSFITIHESEIKELRAVK